MSTPLYIDETLEANKQEEIFTPSPEKTIDRQEVSQPSIEDTQNQFDTSIGNFNDRRSKRNREDYESSKQMTSLDDYSQEIEINDNDTIDLKISTTKPILKNKREKKRVRMNLDAETFLTESPSKSIQTMGLSKFTRKIENIEAQVLKNQEFLIKTNEHLA